MSEPLRPTVEMTSNIVAFIRAGGFPEVAAMAVGLSSATFAAWMELGSQPTAPVEFQEFRATILRTQAQVRLVAEAEVRQSKPLDWLRCGPGRARDDREGWANPARAKPRTEPGGIPPQTLALVQELVARLLTVLGPYPELREKLAQELADFVPSSQDLAG